MSNKERQRDKHRKRRRVLLKQRRSEQRAQAGEAPVVAQTPVAPRRLAWLLEWLPRSWRAALAWLLRERQRALARARAQDVKDGPRAW